MYIEKFRKLDPEQRATQLLLIEEPLDIDFSDAIFKNLSHLHKNDSYTLEHIKNEISKESLFWNIVESTDIYNTKHYCDKHGKKMAQMLYTAICYNKGINPKKVIASYLDVRFQKEYKQLGKRFLKLGNTQIPCPRQVTKHYLHQQSFVFIKSI